MKRTLTSEHSLFQSPLNQDELSSLWALGLKRAKLSPQVKEARILRCKRLVADLKAPVYAESKVMTKAMNREDRHHFNRLLIKSTNLKKGQFKARLYVLCQLEDKIGIKFLDAPMILALCLADLTRSLSPFCTPSVLNLSQLPQTPVGQVLHLPCERLTMHQLMFWYELADDFKKEQYPFSDKMKKYLSGFRYCNSKETITWAFWCPRYLQ